MTEEHGFVMLFNDHCEFDLDARDWRRLLWIAQCYGWQPAGTNPPDAMAIDGGMWHGSTMEWDGRYFPSYGQGITPTDTLALASALERALPDIPNGRAAGQPRAGANALCEAVAAVPTAGTNCLEAFNGLRVERVRTLITHCREAGGLWVY